MINNKKVLAVIPARGGSKGLPRKNIKKLIDKPLVAWPISAALNSSYVDKVVVTTDDIEIANVAERYGACVPFLRPAKLASDNAPSSAAISHVINHLEDKQEFYDYIVLLEPTSPLTEGFDIDKALSMLVESKMDSIVGISEVESSHPEFCIEMQLNNTITPYQKKSFDAPKRRQDLTPLYYLDGSLYISKVKAYKNNETFYHDKTMGYLSEYWKGVEIDTLFDFLVVETIMNNKKLFKSI